MNGRETKLTEKRKQLERENTNGVRESVSGER